MMTVPKLANMEKIREVTSNKSLKANEMVEILCKMISTDVHLFLNDMAKLASADRVRAMEALELYTRAHVIDEIEMVEKLVMHGIMQSNTGLIREACRVIANTASADLNYDNIVVRLLELSEHGGTVIRWAAATALVSLASHHPIQRRRLEEVFESILAREEKNSIRKIYLRLKKE